MNFRVVTTAQTVYGVTKDERDKLHNALSAGIERSVEIKTELGCVTLYLEHIVAIEDGRPARARNVSREPAK